MQQRSRWWGMMALGFALRLMAVSPVAAAWPATLEADVPVDVSGAWVFAVKTDRGSGQPTFVFKQQGKALKGTYRGFFGEAPIEGTMEGRAIKFSFKTRSPLNPLIKVNVTYSGRLDQGTRTMSGTVAFEGQGSGTWTGKRKPEEGR